MCVRPSIHCRRKGRARARERARTRKDAQSEFTLPTRAATSPDEEGIAREDLTHVIGHKGHAAVGVPCVGEGGMAVSLMCVVLSVIGGIRGRMERQDQRSCASPNKKKRTGRGAALHVALPKVDAVP